ncbi:hypothetical protein QJ48_04275 [Paenibacillus sp. A3]|uniref:hypothetical protein n=1 Tax=Paenibacillus sp. A3 TaxID=1337054 RepID=UPI0006D5B5F6|nr:hypothetical protein [Paenibacillus sp. A3]KPV60745.1 hypothetical protein QJ48_04275 [Paenibacillus sp. A3]
MKRIIYVAGVNRKHLAAAASSIPYWLLSATLLRKYPTWLAQHMPNRTVLWDPGTFSEDAISYQGYRDYLDRYARSKDQYFQYDEIGDSEATAWYLKDMRKRGYEPIPILQGDAFHLLHTERMIGIGGLVRMRDDERRRYLDEIFYDHRPTARVHMLGMIRHEWFAPYEAAVQGDNTSWIPRADWNRRKSVEQWLKEYGEQWIPFVPREFMQGAIGL